MENKRLKKAKGGLFRIIFSRTGLILLMILLQMAILIVTTSMLRQYTIYINMAVTVLRVCVLIYIINSEANPAFKMTWLLCIMAFPVVGTLFYVYVELQIGTSWVGEKLEILKLEENPYMIQEKEIIEEIRER